VTERITWTTQRRKLGDLVDWPRNPRSLTLKQAQDIEASLHKFGLADPPVINTDNVLIGGHQRKRILLIMRDFGADAEIDVRVPSRPLSEREVEELNIRLNKNTGSFDFDALANTFDTDDLLAWGFEAAELGIEDAPAEVTDAEPQIDRADELRQKWGVEAGQLWQLGDHRLICGDCTDAGVVARVMAGERADMVFTDPPYNVASESRNFAADRSKAMADLKNAEWDKDFDVATIFPVLEMVMANDCAVYVCTSQWLVQRIWEWMWSWSDYCFYCVWCKPNPMPSLAKRHWTWATELIAYAVRGKHVSNFPDGEHALNWWDIAKDKETAHPTEKVLGVVTRPIAFSSTPGAIVFDGFSGSGTTLIACESLSRRCRAVEISPAYVAVALQRWHDATGKTPQLITES
jgi:DNA modification methylase